MVGSISASLISGVTQLAASFRNSGDITSRFGPDYLLSVLGGGQTSGAAYNANGQSYAPPADSPQGRARTEAINKARAALLTKRYSDARDAAQRVLARDPNDVVALYYTGRSHLEEGQYSQAERFLSQAAELSGDERIASDLRAARLFQQGNDVVQSQISRLISQPGTQTEGLRLATHLLKAEPDNLDARLVLVDFYESQGRLNIAGAELLDAVGVVSKDQSSTLIARLEKFAANHPYDSGSHDLLAQAYARFGQVVKAESSFAEALRLLADDPIRQQEIRKDYAVVLSKVGRAARDAGDEAGARIAFRRALELSRDDERRADLADFEYLAGDRALRSGNLRGALASMEQARINFPIEDKAGLKNKLIAAYEKLATRFSEQGDLQRVVAAKNGSFQLDAADDDKRRSLAEAHVAYGQSLVDRADYYGAVKAFRAATKLYHDDANYTALLAEALSHVT